MLQELFKEFHGFQGTCKEGGVSGALQDHSREFPMIQEFQRRLKENNKGVPWVFLEL